MGQAKRVSREPARVALSRHVALDLWCQEMHEAWSLGCRRQESPLSQHAKAFPSPWTGFDRKERSEVRESKEGV